MRCHICGKEEMQTSPDGSRRPASRPHANEKKEAKAMICAKCTALLYQYAAEIDWGMSFEELRTLVEKRKTKQPTGLPRIRRTK